MVEEDYRSVNRALWDERVPIHVQSEFYDVAGFKAGGLRLRDFELAEMGDVTGRTLVHLQCHFGLDTLSWARCGAKVTGLDFSQPAVETATKLADEIGIDARFVIADVYDAAEALGETYDIVYTGLGALVWLPDVKRWAEVVTSLLKPGGVLYLAEFHPAANTLDDAEGKTVAYDYFNTGPVVWDEPGTYAQPGTDTKHSRSIEFEHGLGEVVTAITEAGLRLEFLHEHDFTLFPRFASLVVSRESFGLAYRFPEERPRMPLMYSLRAKAKA